jgi:hypothetical protein
MMKYFMGKKSIKLFYLFDLAMRMTRIKDRAVRKLR